MAEQSAVGQAMSAALGRLFAVAEAYPELKADANFRDLQDKLSGIEDEIQLSRRYYNGAVRNLNTMIESFPTNFVANQFKFEKAEFFEIGDRRGARSAEGRLQEERHARSDAFAFASSSASRAEAWAEERITSFVSDVTVNADASLERARDDLGQCGRR